MRGIEWGGGAGSYCGEELTVELSFWDAEVGGELRASDGCCWRNNVIAMIKMRYSLIRQTPDRASPNTAGHETDHSSA